jgi:hypothetical protein
MLVLKNAYLESQFLRKSPTTHAVDRLSMRVYSHLICIDIFKQAWFSEHREKHWNRENRIIKTLIMPLWISLGRR